MTENTQELEHPINAISAGQDILVSVWSRANESGWMTITGLDPTVLTGGSLLADDEDKIVLFVSGMGDAAAWARGDFSLYVREKVRERTRAEGWSQAQYNEVWATELDRLSRRFGVSPKTLQNNIATCSAWSHADRVAGQHVRYKHHEALPADMDKEEKISYLLQCEENGWTWARLYKIARGNLLPDGSEGTPARGNPLLNGTPVDEQIETNGVHAQDDDELDTIDTNGLTDADEVPYDFAPVEPDDIPELPEGWDDFGNTDAAPEPQFGVATMNAINSAGDDDNWVSMSLLGTGGVGTQILTEANAASQTIHALFSDGSIWQVVFDTTMNVVRVEHL